MFTLKRGDCLELMCDVPDKSVDLILCDLPYGTTKNKWDSVIPFDALWGEYKRISRGAIVLTAQAPFDKVLGASNIDMLRYEWIWQKTKATGHLNANVQPMKNHENVLVFLQETIGVQPTGAGKEGGSNHPKGQKQRYKLRKIRKGLNSGI